MRITGITNDTLRDKKRFEHPDVVDQLMAFFGDDPIVAHNAEFDRGFLNYELELLGRPPLPKERFIDTLVLAREHRPGSPASLDAVCKRFNISIQDRVLHGALLEFCASRGIDPAAVSRSRGRGTLPSKGQR